MGKYNVKNYTEQGGDVTHIGGELVIEDGGELIIEEGAVLVIKDGGMITGFPVVDNQPDSTAETLEALVSDFNDLLTNLKGAGIMDPDSGYAL